MSTVRTALMISASLLAATGCHPRYKKMAGKLGSVRPVVSTPGGPSVAVPDLDVPEDAGPVAEAVGVAVAVGAAAEAGQTQSAMMAALPPADLAAAIEAALLDAPAEAGLPHKIGPNGKHEMEVWIADYGIDVSTGEPYFTTTVQVRIRRKRDGKRMYRASTSCSVSIADLPDIPIASVQQAQAFQSMGQIQGMPTDELRAIALAGVERCGERVVERMVDHAG